MPDFAVSDHPAVQEQLDRLGALSLPQGRFGLETITALLARLGDPQRRLPSAFHVAGTNGKGSTCALLRAMLEAAGHRTHVYTSPHLVRFNERIRVAGKLIEDAALAVLLAEVLDAADAARLAPSFFEVTTAAAFLAFARTPADACVIEVGMGGRFDATNVLPAPAACGIASLGIDHAAFLLAPEPGTPAEPLARIAFEKAGIARRGVPLVTFDHTPAMNAAIDAQAGAAGASVYRAGREWDCARAGERIEYADATGRLALPLPALAGEHQARNAGLAIAMLRHQQAVAVPAAAMDAAMARVRWPARLQRLGDGPLTARAAGRAVWLDGAHNADAAAVLARAMAGEAPLGLVFALLANRGIAEVLGPLAPLADRIRCVPIPGHAYHPPEALAAYAQSAGVADATPAADVAEALEQLAGGTILIAGSLYLAGEVLRLNRELPD